jgi:hypothetical protein
MSPKIYVSQRFLDYLSDATHWVQLWV